MMPAILVGAAFISGCLLSLPLAGQDREGFHELPSGRLAPPQRPTQSVSVDMLRHPISSKTQRMLQCAVDWMRADRHQEAIRQLEDTLSKDPSSAAYVHSLLGFEYMKTDQFASAVNSFVQAAALLPHDAINHQNLAVSLAATGDYEGAREQTRRAHELAPDNPEIQRFRDALLASKRSTNPVIVANTP